MLVNPRDKLLPLINESNRKYIDDYLDVLSQMETPDDMGRVMYNRGKGWGASYGQMFGPLMKNLYNASSDIRETVHQELRQLGVTNEAINEYFTKYVQSGSFVINYAMDSIPNDQKKPFMEKSDQLMLDTLKRYVGIKRGYPSK
jgi:hypothetical protein